MVLVNYIGIFVVYLFLGLMLKIRQGMTSEECVENKWFNMKYIGKYFSAEILLTHECISQSQRTTFINAVKFKRAFVL